jgi:hypothetical protein
MLINMQVDERNIGIDEHGSTEYGCIPESKQPVDV